MLERLSIYYYLMNFIIIQVGALENIKLFQKFLIKMNILLLPFQNTGGKLLLELINIFLSDIVNISILFINKIYFLSFKILLLFFIFKKLKSLMLLLYISIISYLISFVITYTIFFFPTP